MRANAPFTIEISRGRADGGFALPATILALVVAAVLVAGSMFVVQQQIRIASAAELGTEGFILSERGLSEVQADWDAETFMGLATWGDTSIDHSFASGTSTTRVTRLADRLFLLEAASEVTAGGALLSGAGRRSAVLVRMFTPDIPLPAALTTRGPTELRGNAEVHGEDEVPAGWGGVCTAPLSDKIGILTDDSTTVTTKGQGEVTGVPAVGEDSTISDSTFTQFGELTWADLVATADKTVPPGNINGTGPVSSGGVCSTSVVTNWGDPDDPAGPCGSYFPIIHVPGNARIQSGGVGQGILLVDGDLDLRGNFSFHGIVIVQGELGTQGNGNRVFGGVLAGNVTIDSQVLTGGSEITNSTCAVSRSILNSGLARPRPLARRSWVDVSAVN